MRMPFTSVIAMWLSPVVLDVILNGTPARPVDILAVDLVEGDVPALHLLARGGVSSLGSTKVETNSDDVFEVIC